MKYLSQFFLILSFSLGGELLNRLIPLPIPGSVYGIVGLFAALCMGLIKLEQVKQAGDFLTDLLPLLFVPSVVGLLENWQLIRSAIVPILLLVLATTVTTFAVCGRITQRIMEKEEQENG